MSIDRQGDPDPDGATAFVVGSPDHWVHGEMPFHRHDRHQLIYTMRGVIRMTTRTGEWILPPNRALWIAGGVEHALVAKRPTETRTLYVRRDAPGAPDWPDCVVLEVTPLMRELIATCARQPWHYPARSPEARLASVLLEQLPALDHLSTNLPVPNDPRAMRIVDLLRRDPGSRAPLAQVARQVGASARTLDRLFIAQTGMGFGAWRRRHRLLVALEQLAEGESVTNVALDVGYESSSSFIASFRTAFGVTPNRYFAVPAIRPPKPSAT